MKIIYNLLSKVGIAASLLAITSLALAPLDALALGSKSSAVGTPQASSKTSPFCANLTTETSNITTKLNNLIAKADQAWSTRDQNWTTLWQKVDTTVAADRAKADTLRAQQFTKLQARAKTATQTAGVQAYITAIDNAVSVRRAAFDSARHTFRGGVLAAISSRQATVTSQFNSFQSSVNLALQTAQSSCTATPNEGPSIRTTLQTSLKSARATFQSERKADTTINSQIQQLKVTRNAAFNAATQVFRNSVATSKQGLEKAFDGKSI